MRLGLNVIFDTDMWADIDDALALAMLHALHDRGEINLIGVTVSTEDPWCAPYVDLINAFYGRRDIPVGVVRDGLDPADIQTGVQKAFGEFAPPKENYTQVLAEKKRADGSYVYPRVRRDSQETPDAVALLRELLAGQPDASVVMLQVGFSTNLMRLLGTTPDGSSKLTGRELVARKVRTLSVMAGNFGEAQVGGVTYPRGSPEFNLVLDVPSAQSLFAEWPTPIVASGWEIGVSMSYPAKSVDCDYSYVDDHPIADTYRTYCAGWRCPWPHEHPTFDLTSVLYAARPEGNYFSLSKPGRITILPNGSSRFEESAGGSHRHLILPNEQKARTLEAMVLLTTQPPRHRGDGWSRS